MADIDVVPKRRTNRLAWLLVLVLVAILLMVIFAAGAGASRMLRLSDAGNESWLNEAARTPLLA